MSQKQIAAPFSDQEISAASRMYNQSQFHNQFVIFYDKPEFVDCFNCSFCQDGRSRASIIEGNSAAEVLASTGTFPLFNDYILLVCANLHLIFPMVLWCRIANDGSS